MGHLAGKVQRCRQKYKEEMLPGCMCPDLLCADDGPGKKENKRIEEEKAEERQIPGMKVLYPPLDAKAVVTGDEQSCEDYDEDDF